MAGGGDQRIDYGALMANAGGGNAEYEDFGQLLKTSYSQSSSSRRATVIPQLGKTAKRSGLENLTRGRSFCQVF